MSEIYSVRKYYLTGNETQDCIYLNAVTKLAETCNGEPYLVNDLGKSLYCFEVGGIFDKAEDATKFQEVWDKYDKNLESKQPTKKTRKKVVVTLTKAEAIRFFNAANGMDMFDNGTAPKNGLRRLVQVLGNAINAA